MHDNTKTETYFREPDWIGIRDELCYLSNLGCHGWWGEFWGDPGQERVLGCFGSSSYRLLHGLTKGEDYDCLEMTLGDFSATETRTDQATHIQDPGSRQKGRVRIHRAVLRPKARAHEKRHAVAR